MNAKQISRLQLRIADWIISEGGDFGRDLSGGRIDVDDGVLTINEVALKMAEAAEAVFEMAKRR